MAWLPQGHVPLESTCRLQDGWDAQLAWRKPVAVRVVTVCRSTAVSGLAGWTTPWSTCWHL